MAEVDHAFARFEKLSKQEFIKGAQMRRLIAVPSCVVRVNPFIMSLNRSPPYVHRER